MNRCLSKHPGSTTPLPRFCINDNFAYLERLVLLHDVPPRLDHTGMGFAGSGHFQSRKTCLPRGFNYINSYFLVFRLYYINENDKLTSNSLLHS
jgi:hypothetical protein